MVRLEIFQRISDYDNDENRRTIESKLEEARKIEAYIFGEEK